MLDMVLGAYVGRQGMKDIRVEPVLDILYSFASNEQRYASTQ